MHIYGKNSSDCEKCANREINQINPNNITKLGNMLDTGNFTQTFITNEKPIE